MTPIRVKEIIHFIALAKIKSEKIYFSSSKCNKSTMQFFGVQ